MYIPRLQHLARQGQPQTLRVFLLSIRERYDVTGDNTAAIANSLQRTGGVITSAALHHPGHHPDRHHPRRRRQLRL